MAALQGWHFSLLFAPGALGLLWIIWKTRNKHLLMSINLLVFRVGALGDWESFSPGFATVFSLDLLLLSCSGDQKPVQVILRLKMYNEWEKPNTPARVTPDQEICHAAQQKGHCDTGFQWLWSSWWLPGLGRTQDMGCVCRCPGGGTSWICS